MSCLVVIAALLLAAPALSEHATLAALALSALSPPAGRAGEALHRTVQGEAEGIPKLRCQESGGLHRSLETGLRDEGQPQAAQKPPATKEKRKVWTNDDIEQLRRKAPISVLGQAPPPEEAPGEGEEAAEAGAKKAGAEAAPYAREKDPKWYQQQLKPLRAELDRSEGELRRIRGLMANPEGGKSGVALGTPYFGLSPEDQLDRLERRRRELQKKIDDLEDQARRNGIPHGSLR
jgi:hypothetical protein